VGGQGFACTQAGPEWSARLVVPHDASPGTLPLRWGISSRAIANGRIGADNGILNLGILPPRNISEPRFSIAAIPTKAPPEQIVTVSFASPDSDVDITECSAGLSTSQTICERSADGLAVRLIVPRDAQRGLRDVQWRLSYLMKNGGERGNRAGRLALTVLALPVPPSPNPSKPGIDIRGLLSRLALILVIIAAAAGFYLLRPRIHGSRPKTVTSDDHHEPAPLPQVSVQSHPGKRPHFRSDETGQEPTRFVRITVHNQPCEPTIEEVGV
jgi:hypothetical protein